MHVEDGLVTIIISQRPLEPATAVAVSPSAHATTQLGILMRVVMGPHLFSFAVRLVLLSVAVEVSMRQGHEMIVYLLCTFSFYISPVRLLVRHLALNCGNVTVLGYSFGFQQQDDISFRGIIITQTCLTTVHHFRN